MKLLKMNQAQARPFIFFLKNRELERSRWRLEKAAERKTFLFIFFPQDYLCFTFCRFTFPLKNFARSNLFSLVLLHLSTDTTLVQISNSCLLKFRRINRKKQGLRVIYSFIYTIVLMHLIKS